MLVSKEKVWQGLRMELSQEELAEIFQQEYEEDRYYDFELLMDGLHKVIDKKVDFDYYINWCILIANCFNYVNYETRKINKVIWGIGELFDGASFDDEYSVKSLYETIAMLKHSNHDFEDAIAGKKTKFLTDGVERILVVDHSNYNNDSWVYKLLIVDHDKKEFDLRYVDDGFYDYDENINYTFADEKYLDKVFESFFWRKIWWAENHELKF